MTRRRVLVADDNPADHHLYRVFLEDDPEVDYRIESVTTGSEAIRRVQRAAEGTLPFDILLLDYRLPDMEGTEVLAEIRRLRRRKALPVIMLTGEGSEAVAVTAMKLGAGDYLVKGELTSKHLRQSVDRVVENVELRKLLRRERHRLKDAQRREVRLRDEFLSQVSHELRTPFSVIYRSVDMLLEGVLGEVSEEQREVLEAAGRNCEQLRRMIGDLLESAKAREGKLDLERSALDLPGLASDLVGERRRDALDAGITLTASTSQPLPLAWADSSRVRQVVGNLIDNALEFTPAGGTIEISVRPDPSDPGFLTIAVRDDGCGIAADRQKAIFERLHQVRGDGEDHRGLGFGLYLARRIAELHGGRIDVESSPGKGSTFRLWLPIFTPARILQPVADGQDRLPPLVDLLRLELRCANAGGPVGENTALCAEITKGLRRIVARHPAVLLPIASPSGVVWIAAAEGNGVRGSNGLLEDLRGWLTSSETPPLRPAFEEVVLPSPRCSTAHLTDQLDDLGRRIIELIAYREGRKNTPWNAARSSSSKTIATLASA